MEKLFAHRFGGSGNLTGHSFGNLFIAALIEVLGDVEEAMDATSKVLKVRGKVIPASAEKIQLNAEMTDGRVICGESQIPTPTAKSNGCLRRLNSLKRFSRPSKRFRMPTSSCWAGKLVHQHHAEFVRPRYSGGRAGQQG